MAARPDGYYGPGWFSGGTYHRGWALESNAGPIISMAMSIIISTIARATVGRNACARRAQSGTPSKSFTARQCMTYMATKLPVDTAK